MNLDSKLVGRACAEFARRAVQTSIRSTSAVRADAAERELARVHVIELARLLREAALLRGARGVAGAARLAVWRRRARRELARWRVDGFESPALLRFCAARSIGRWAPARAIAEEALALDPCDAGRRCLARVES